MAARIVIDAGHGGTDTGTSYEQLKEKDLTLSFAQALKQHLDQQTSHKVFLTRHEDIYLSLKRRTLLAEQHRGDLFISIHVNASLNPKAHGAEIYFQNHLPPEEESRFLASRENWSAANAQTAGASPPGLLWPLGNPLKPNQQIAPSAQLIIQDLQRSYRMRMSAQLAESMHSRFVQSGPDKIHRPVDLLQAPFYVVSNVPMPAILIEIGYLSNSDDRELLTSTEFKTSWLASATRGLNQFISKRCKSALTCL